MRVSIWQQFSSNHSASFTVVGVFDAVDRLEGAAAELRAAIELISQWRRIEYQNDESESQQDNPFPPDIAEHYGITPDETQLWLSGDYDIQVMGQNIIVQSPITWAKPEALKKVLKKIGGKTFSEFYSFGDPNPHIRTRLTFTAPDESIAQSLHTTISEYIRDKKHKRPPWGQITESWGVYGTASITGCEVIMEVWLVRIVETLPLIVAYLESKGCHHIHCTFTEVEGIPY